MIEDSLIGRQLANFRIERSLGRGGMAQVYYGQDVKLQRPVAIKVIDVRYRGNPAYAERFVREAQAVATWRHEHIIQIYYADDEDGLYYFVMEYIDGLDLGQLIAQHRDKAELLPHAEVLRIGRAFASALDYAHKQGVVHRDVKPSNLMVASDGRVVLTDFGLAMDVEQGSLGEVFGSAQYIAPEQARRSADAIPPSDLYSLGVILYELLTGRVPFDDPSPTAVALQHMTLDPPAPRELNPDLNEATAAVLLKALRKAPEERYQTGKALIDALEQALQAADQPAGAALGAPPNLLGQQLDEYRLEALEGQGGMARVYRGVDVRLNRRVAIKVIDTPFRTDSDYVMRFQREAQAIAQLEHPHIVRLYRYGEALGVLYIAMQHIEGKNLHSLIAKHRQERAFIPAEEVSRIIRQVGQALDYAHSQGVIHRDVKPSNIMLNKEGTVFLTDFGLALLTEVGTRGEILGSPHYIAPEQAMSSANVTPQSDLYAVGVILYEMLTGELPFEAGEPLEIAMLHMTEPPPAPGELRPGLSRPVEAVLLKALAKKPEERYASGAALAEALDEALRSAPISDAPAGASLPVRAEAAKAAGLPPIPAAVAPQPSEPRPEP
ncbi:MAG: serine/threonine-protein kinase, partial [Chloroflexota bacterium]